MFRAKIEKLFEREPTLPVLPAGILDWIVSARPIVDGHYRDFMLAPFWEDVYNDNNSDIMILNGRQTFKSTFCTDLLAFEATTHNGVQVCYVTHNETNLRAFSKQRLRVGTFLQNKILKQFPRNGIGNSGEISLKNNSTIYLVTDNNEYIHVEGKSLSLCVLDEAQYQELQFLAKLEQSMTVTKGRLLMLGIGGERGSEYERLWLRTDQREWIFKDKYWRENLRFDENGLILGDYLYGVLDGKWVPQKPENRLYHGYHMPQTIFPMIPLTIEEAVRKYHIHPKHSIEWRQQNVSQSVFETHVMGQFYKGLRRPITREMVLACMTLYRYLGLLKEDEITDMKATYQKDIRILMGVDFGSGPTASSTVVSIIIKWKKSNRYQLAWIEKRPLKINWNRQNICVNYSRNVTVILALETLVMEQIRLK